MLLLWLTRMLELVWFAVRTCLRREVPGVVIVTVECIRRMPGLPPGDGIGGGEMTRDPGREYL